VLLDTPYSTEHGTIIYLPINNTARGTKTQKNPQFSVRKREKTRVPLTEGKIGPRGERRNDGEKKDIFRLWSFKRAQLSMFSLSSSSSLLSNLVRPYPYPVEVIGARRRLSSIVSL
jgi:hypothetical protein